MPGDESVPHLPGWRWVHTPGHTTGHVSLFREEGHVLIAGDAIITVNQDRLADFVARPPVLHGPPVYFTPDWDAAVRSVRRLAGLDPKILATGHGQAAGGPDLPQRLRNFAARFRPPTSGRYVARAPGRDADGRPIDLPPRPLDWPLLLTVAGLGAAALLLLAAARRTSR